jgi:hypothetical protein
MYEDAAIRVGRVSNERVKYGRDFCVIVRQRRKIWSYIPDGSLTTLTHWPTDRRSQLTSTSISSGQLIIQIAPVNLLPEGAPVIRKSSRAPVIDSKSCSTKDENNEKEW